MLRWDRNLHAVTLILVAVGMAAGIAPIAKQKRRLPVRLGMVRHPA
ncbi:MAG: hypothetical protein PHU43_06510 [Candidatus Bipolaricaulis sp.]|nr:hypothetical protein [Candidatus Bipolaricaulis sp.]